MSRPHLAPVCRYVAERTGSALSRHQLARLEEAICSRQGGREVPAYLSHLQSLVGAAELAELMSVISVHKTDLFRDEVQLQAVSTKLLPALLAEHRSLKVWSAGCATGEEVATLLILLEQAGAAPTSTVLGSDIAAGALQTAQQLAFAPEAMKRVPEAVRARHFHQQAGRFALSQQLAARASWVRHNLIDHPYPLAPDGGAFDLIFCRNVLIYFTEAAWEKVVNALVERLRPGGVLVLGAAEPLLGNSHQLEVLRYAQAFFFRRRTGLNPDPPPAAAQPTLRWAPSPSAPTAPPVRTSTLDLSNAELDPRSDGERLFELVLEWSAAGQSDDQTEAGLRKALYLTPELAPARYLLGMLAEQRGAKADAGSEYRRALAMLNDGKARQTPFFLNTERLKLACQQALLRVSR